MMATRHARTLCMALALLCATCTQAKRCFPHDFMFGSATAAAQVEGGWNETNKGWSIWDAYCREHAEVACPNVADDFIHRYKDDIQLMKDTNLSAFRFSISWPRVMSWNPRLRTMEANPPGILFYHAMIDELNANGIEPILTLYHWDLPLELSTELEPTGWLHRDIIDHFNAYATLMYKEFGCKVRYWTTFNEPHSFVVSGYSEGREAPGIKGSDTAPYTATHHVMISHASAVQSFRALQATGVVDPKARISIVLNHDYTFPLDPLDPADVAAAERVTEFGLGWFLQPIVSGDYPSVMRERLGARLPHFSEQESLLLKGSYDLFMLNHYSSKLATDCASNRSTIACSDLPVGWDYDLGVDHSVAPEGAVYSGTNAAGEYNCAWFTAYPPGYMETIRWMHRHDEQAQILLTENGFCGNATIDSQEQLWYYQTYLDQVHKAITEEKIPIIGYTAWSFLDNYEWGSFEPRFGLYYVEYPEKAGSKEGYAPKSSDLERIPRTAAKWYSALASTGCIEDANDAIAMTTAAVSDEESDDSGWWSVGVIVGAGIVLVAVAIAVATWRRRSSGQRRESQPLLEPRSGN